MIADKYKALLEFSASLGDQNDYEQILRVVSSFVTSELRADRVVVLMINPRTGETVKTVMHEGGIARNSHYRNLQNQVGGWILYEHCSLLSRDIHSDGRFKNVQLGNINIESVIGAPIRLAKQAFGVLLGFNKQNSHVFDRGHLGCLEQIANIAAPYLKNAQEIQHYFDPPLPNAALLSKYADLGLLGKSKPFIEALKTVETAARCDVRVILEGPTGTGKGVIARAIHALSARKNKSFKAVDCGALPEHLIESELFGHLKGAFTGATQDRKGLFLDADGGTLFLDEISNLSINMQAKLLLVLQDREVRPVGSDKTQKIDVRVIAASSGSLKKLVECGEFREDLYYRLSVFPLKLPSLNERKEDIPLLAETFLKKFAAEQNKTLGGLHDNILDFLKLKPWPGNIRELENFVERLVTFAPIASNVLKPSDLPALKKEFAQLEFKDAHVRSSLPERVEAFEKDIILKTLIKHDWKQAKAARALKISPQALRYKMERLFIKPPQ